MSCIFGFKRFAVSSFLVLLLSIPLFAQAAVSVTNDNVGGSFGPVADELDELIVTDELVWCDEPTIDSIYDPEFDLAGGLVTWQEPGPWPNTGLWVARVDNNGDFVDTAMIDLGLPGLAEFRNGPEWSYGGDHASMIVYTRQNPAGEYSLVRAYQSDPHVWDWTVEDILFSEDCGGPLGNMDTDGLRDPRILFARIEDHGGVEEYVPYWSYLDSFLDPQPLPPEIGLNNLDIGIGRLAQNANAIITTIPGAVEYDRDTFVWDIDEDHLIQLTETPGLREGDSFMWQDPVVEDRYRFFSTIQNAAVHPQDIEYRGLRIYKVENNVISLERTILPQNNTFRFVISPEPLIVGEQSFVVYLLSTERMANDDGLGQVWVASVDAGGLNRRISRTLPRVRKDPEPYNVDGNVWVFYTEFDNDGTKDIRRCSFEIQ